MVETMFMQWLIRWLEKYLIRKNSFRLSGVDYDMIMLIPSDKYSQDVKYSLLISAQFLNKSSHKDTIKELLYGFKEELAPVEYNAISRINVLNTEDSFVKNIKFMFGLRQEVTEINRIVVGGVEIDFAYLLRSLMLDKLKEGNVLMLMIRNEIGVVEWINAAIIGIDQVFEVKYYTEKGMRELREPYAKDEKVQALRQESEYSMVQKGYIAKIKFDNILRVF